VIPVQVDKKGHLDNQRGRYPLLGKGKDGLESGAGGLFKDGGKKITLAQGFVWPSREKRD